MSAANQPAFEFDTSGLSRSDPTPKGRTFDKSLDDTRLKGQRERVMALMSDGVWRSLSEIQKRVGGSQTGIAARLREARQVDFGSHTVESRRRGDPKRGIWEYRVIVNKGANGLCDE